MMDEETKHLLSLLEEAVEEMIACGEKPTFSYFDKCKDVGLFIQDITDKMRNGELDEVSELWYIFAPTGVWDDSGGSQEIANKIFEVLNRKYRPEH